MDYRSTSNLAADLGTIDYNTAYRLQKHLVELVKSGRFGGFLLFLDHDPVYTVGRKFSRENFPEVDAVETERGGDVTYHGPGQVVIYPIVNIAKDNGLDVRAFVHFVEDTVIDILSTSGYSAGVGEEPGIWVKSGDEERKVASIGMAIDHGISFHGVSINVSGEVLSGFSRIRPCGLDPKVMNYVNVERELIRKVFIDRFSSRFGSFRMAAAAEFYEYASFNP